MQMFGLSATPMLCSTASLHAVIRRRKKRIYTVRRDNGNAPYGLNVARGN